MMKKIISWSCVLSLGFVSPVSARAADSAPESSEKRSRAYPNQPTDAEQEKALKALAKARKEATEFVYLFPDSTFSVVGPDHKGVTWIELRAKAPERVTIAFDAQFSADFTEIKEVRFLRLQIALVGIILKDFTKPSELEAFLESPVAFIAAEKKKLTLEDIPEVLETHKVKMAEPKR